MRMLFCRDEVAALMGQVAGVYGKIDILCNNAGIEGEMAMIADMFPLRSTVCVATSVERGGARR